MKSAAMESHFRGQQILNEAVAKKKAFDPRAFETHGTRPPVAHGKPDIDPTVVRIAAQELAKTPTTVHSIELAGGDAGAYTNIRRMKHAEKLGELNKARGPVDEKPAGNANDVAVDAEDGTMADPDGEWMETTSGLPTYKLAAQARGEHARESWRESHRAERVAKRHAHTEAEHEAGEESRQEGIEGIVDRMMRRKH